MDHILSPVDGSESSFRALEVAAKLAKRLGAKHTVLAVRQYVVGRKTLAEVWSDSDLKDIFKRRKRLSLLPEALRQGLLNAEHETSHTLSWITRNRTVLT